MLKILLPISALLFFSEFYWSSSIITLFFLSFLSLLFLYSPFTSFTFSSEYFFLDQLSVSLISLTFWISALMIICSHKIYINSLSNNMFCLYISILALILILCFSMSNFMAFYVLFEASLIPTFLLIMGWGYQPERLQASFYLLLYTITASLPLLLSLSWIFYNNGSLSLNIHPQFMNPALPFHSSYIWWSITILAFMVKMPLYSMHLWLPKAHVEAPVAGSMILAGILLKLGGYGLIRLTQIYPSLSFSISPMFSSLAIFGGVLTSFICLRQTDLKSLIAYSSIGHMALVVLGVSFSSLWGWQGAIVMMIAHGLCSSCMFALANMTYEFTSTRSLFLTKGILALAPAFSMWWFLLSITNMAAPPSINLFGEISIILASLWFSHFLILPLGVCSFLACAYSFFLYTSSNHGPSPSFSNPYAPLNSSFHTAVLLHFFPIWGLILKPEIISQFF
uniref:NADH-ubiquinone oxidoreductase chain 4 n=1 Tax=Pisione sp. YZ-2018 TaxID=2153337 RepID=A0A343W6J0_9ANNE|nr:NADH dehydrogenase subunit 4 [Pisione sp. YZ-2018]